MPEFGDPEHPNGSLLALYVVAKDPATRDHDQGRGQDRTEPRHRAADDDVRRTRRSSRSASFTLKFRPGATAPLISPPVCGAYARAGSLTPWSAPRNRHDSLEPAFQITQGIHEGACPAGGVPPFHPQVISGTQNNAGGSYSPFYLRILREDGEQEITRFSTTLPPGLTGNLSGIPFCPEADIEAARGVTRPGRGGTPLLPASLSEIGHTIVSAGVGSVLAQNPGKIYLAGPYNGAPLSIVSIT